MTNWLEDVRYALRALAARPVYALASIAVLAIAIGANTTVFSVFNGLFLRPLPYPDGDRLVMVYDSYPKLNMPNAGTSIPDYLDRREQRRRSRASRSSRSGRARSPAKDRPQRLRVARASASLFEVLRIAPVARPRIHGRRRDARQRAGRGFELRALERALRRAAGHRRQRHSARRRLVPRCRRLPEGFGFLDRGIDAYVPFAFTPEQRSDAARGNQFSISIGRLAPGATVEGLERRARHDRAAQRRRGAPVPPTPSRRPASRAGPSRCAT